MIIGRFAENPASGRIIGHIRSLFVRSDNVVFEPVASEMPNAPAYRILAADDVELGAAWRARGAADGEPRYDVRLDDPAFARPVHARLVKARPPGRGMILVWERRPRPDADDETD